MKAEIKQRIAQFNNGEVPQGYKVTTVGIVPQEWAEHTLGDIFTFKNGLNKEKEAFGEGTPIVNYTDVWKKRGLRTKDIKGRVTLSSSEIENYEAKCGDVFFTRTSETIDEIGYSSVLLEDIENVVFSGFVLRARPYNDLICKEYHQYCYSQPNMRHEIIKRSSMTTRALTSGPMLSQVSINIPSVSEQSKIAEILMKWDEAIELQEKQLDNLKVKKDAVLQRLIKKDDSWLKISLRNILKERTEFATKDEGYPHVTLSKSGVAKKTEQYNRDFLVKSEDKKYKITRHNDICYNPANLKFGVICINKLTEESIFSPIYITYEVDPKYNVDFIGAVLCSTDFIRYIRKYEEGTVYERQAVKSSDFLRGEIWVPATKGEQDKIASIIKKIDDYIEIEQQKYEALCTQRKALQQYLLNGIVRVNK